MEKKVAQTFLCDPQSHMGLEQQKELNFDFWVSYPFNSPPSPSKNKCSIATNRDKFAL